MTQTPKKSGFGILTVQTQVLADALHLPAGYRIIGIDANPRVRGIDLTLMSDDLPEVAEDQEIPTLSLYATVHFLPDVPPEYRYITTEIRRIP